MTPFEHAMAHLETRDEALITLHRQNAAHLLERGLKPDQVEEMLTAVDLQEEVLRAVREKLWEMVA